MSPLQCHLTQQYQLLHISNYDASSHPGILFEGMQYQLTVIVGGREIPHTEEALIYSGVAMRWASEERNGLFERLEFTRSKYRADLFTIPKLGRSIEREIADKLCDTNENFTALNRLLIKNGKKVYYRNAGNVYFRVFLTKLPNFTVNGKEVDSSTFKVLNVTTHPNLVAAVLSSNLYYWWWSKTSDIYHVVARDIATFPIPNLAGNALSLITDIHEKYQKDLFKNSRSRTYKYPTGIAVYQELYPRNSKLIQDVIDSVLAEHYGFTEEELDFIINYDIKYRLGRDGEEDA